MRSREGLARIDLDPLPPSDQPRALHFSGSGLEWHRPTTLAEVHRLKREFVRAVGVERVKLVFGNTAAGIYQQEKRSHFIDISAIAELAQLTEQRSGILVGAAVT